MGSCNWRHPIITICCLQWHPDWVRRSTVDSDWHMWAGLLYPNPHQDLCPEAPTRQTRNVSSQLSGVEDLVSIDFITDEFIPDGDGQVSSGSESLPDPVENVPPVVHIKTLWRDNLLHTSSLLGGRWVWWRVDKKNSVADQFAVKYKSETYYWTRDSELN